MNHSDDAIDIREIWDDSAPVDVVLAHQMLGTVSAAKGALDLVISHELDGSTEDGLLKLAARRLDALAKQLRLMSAGHSGEAFAVFVEPARRDLRGLSGR